jgi:hypothetical protein
MIFSVERTVPLARASTARRFCSNGDKDTVIPDTRTSIGPSSEISTIETPYRKDHFDRDSAISQGASRRHGIRPCRARRLRTHAVELPETIDPRK